MADPTSGPDTELLYETPETGQLRIDPDTGKAIRVADQDPNEYQGPSLSGPQPSFTAVPAKGLGNTDTGTAGPSGPSGPESPAQPSVVAANGQPHTGSTAGQVSQGPRQLTPEELMRLAKAMEDDLKSQTEAAKAPHSSYLEPTAAASRFDQNEPTVPDWLSEYMSKQAPTDPYHQTMPGRVDIINSNKYMTAKEKLEMIKNMKAQQTF